MMPAAWMQAIGGSLKRRIDILWREADALMQWVCDHRDFGPHN